MDRAATVSLLGEPGTGKTPWAIALGVAAAQQGRAVRLASAGRLGTALVEAPDARDLGRLVSRYRRLALLVLDALGYLPQSHG
jgi:DNA replication protein DnaC